MMTLAELIARKKAERQAKIEARNSIATELAELRSQDEVDLDVVTAKRSEMDGIDAGIDDLTAEVRGLEAEQERDNELSKLAEQRVDTGAVKPAYDKVARVGAEERTYRKDQDPKGVQFLSDVVAGFVGNHAANERLQRHTVEEQVERKTQMLDRAATVSSAFAGLVIPEYLTELYATYPRADRPLADAMTKHDLPATGMTAYIGKITTGTSVDEQSSEDTTVSETNIDDTLLSVPILTAAGSQSVSRQAIERGIGVEGTTINDLISAYRTRLDYLILNRASTGLVSNGTSTAIAYTTTTPTATGLYPKLLSANSATEAALLNADAGDVMAVMHSRRWNWLSSELVSTWPFINQPGLVAGAGAGENYGARYGAGFRGVLPNNTPVIVDNNIVTTLGAATNQDEIYFISQRESHLWEDPNAPLLIRAEQTQSKKLVVDLVVYGYFAFLFTRIAHAQRISGTGLTAPTFGV